ncbi:response regulator transcription factor [Patescibacteria group bacterium]
METEIEKKQKETVFLIDDDDFLLDMYALKFKTVGFNVDIAHGGEEAFTKLKEGLKPDIILLDILMQKIDGFEFLEMLKKENMLDEHLIIILSNRGQKEDIERGKKLGVADYIVKASFTPSEVVEKVKEVLGRN